MFFSVKGNGRVEGKEGGDESLKSLVYSQAVIQGKGGGRVGWGGGRGISRSGP